MIAPLAVGFSHPQLVMVIAWRALGFSALTLNSASSIEWYLGAADCQQRSSNIARHDIPALGLVGTGFYQCLEQGSPVGSCSGQQQSCSSSIAADARAQDFSVCVIENNSQLRLDRLVTDDLINNALNICPNSGQSEQLLYQKAVEGSASLLLQGSGFEPILPGESNTTTFTLVNSGTIDATGLTPSTVDLPFRYSGGNYPGTNGTCGTLLPRISSCSLELEFVPTAVGTFSAPYSIAFNNGSAVVSLQTQLTGVAEQPLAQIVVDDPPTATFGNIGVGLTATLSIRFKNIGSGEATSLSMVGLTPPFRFSGSGAYPGTTGDCDTSLAVDGECTIEVEFTPAATGFFAATLIVVYNDGLLGRTLNVAISGNGI